MDLRGGIHARYDCVCGYPVAGDGPASLEVSGRRNVSDDVGAAGNVSCGGDAQPGIGSKYHVTVWKNGRAGIVGGEDKRQPVQRALDRRPSGPGVGGGRVESRVAIPTELQYTAVLQPHIRPEFRGEGVG